MSVDHLQATPVSATKAFLALALLPLLIVALSGTAIYFNLSSQTEQEARAHSENISKLLAGQVSAFVRNKADAVNLMANHHLVQSVLINSKRVTPNDVKPELQRFCTTLGASICYLMDKEGLAIADNRSVETSIVGNNYGFRPYFQQAVVGNDSVHLALGVTTKKRGIYFSSPVFDKEKVIGVAVIKFPPTQIESDFQGLSGDAALVDDSGIVFASSDPKWLYKSLFSLTPAQQTAIVSSRQFGDTPPQSIGFKSQPNGFALDHQGQEYLIRQVAVTGLDGWHMSYLLKPEMLARMDDYRNHQVAIVIIVVMFICTLIAVGRLYGGLKSALRRSNDYQDALEQSQGRLQRFEEVSTEAVFILDGERTIDVNKPAEWLLGYEHDELMSLRPDQLFSADCLDTALRNTEEQSEEPFQASLMTKQGEEIPVITFGRTVLWKGKKVRAVSYRDIRNRIAAQKQLTDSQNRFRQLSDLVAEGLLIYVEDDIIDVNNAFCSLIGLRKEDLVSTSVKALLGEDAIETISLHCDSSEEAYELVLPRQDGTDFPAEVSTASMEFDDGLYKVLSVRDISSQKEQEEHILYQAQYDLLTHIPNRFLARDRAEQAIKNTNRNGGKMVLMFIDLDGFKKVNDSLGHDVGDRVLQLASQRFSNCIRNNDTLARHGGDEFLIILENMDHPQDAELIINKIIQEFSVPFSINNNELVVTASIGVSVYPDDADNYQSLLRAADIGMYRAKKEGRNTFHYYTQEMNDIATRQLVLDTNLLTAMEKDEFDLAYQPLVCGLSEGQPIIGAEVLLRWNSESLGSVSPVEFIPLTEQTGLIIPIGRWILEKACKQAKQWVDQGHEKFRLSVNVSPRQFKGNDFISDLLYALEASQLSPNNLSIEVTEGLLIQASPELNDTLNSITEMGIKLCMDDFGTGYSSLSYLQSFPFNNLKIDRSFIKDLPHNNDSKILVTATIAMAHKLGLTITAEGVETEEQLEFFRGSGCDLLQGYLLGKPVAAEVFEERLLRL